jgi:hypothetical protein
MKKLKQGDASRGPEGKLVLFFGKQGNSTVECPVFGKEYGEEFGMGGLFFIFHLFFLTFFSFCRATDAGPVRFQLAERRGTSLGVCAALRDVRELHQATRDLLETFSLAHSALQSKDQNVFVTEHASSKVDNPDLLGAIRNVQQMCVNSGVCRDAIFYMMSAKLHEEMSEIVERGELTVQFRNELSKMCNAYGIELKPSSLERYLPAGRLMLKCKALAFVNVSLLLDQQMPTGKLLEHEEMVQKLLTLAFGPRLLLGPPELLEVEQNGDQKTIAATIGGLMRGLRSTAAREELATTRVNAVFSALDFARVLNGPGGAVVRPLIWEYVCLLNANLKSGHCLLENFRVEKVPQKNLDWIAIAHCVEKRVVVHMYEPLDDHVVQGLVNVLAAKLGFPKGYCIASHSVNGYEDVGLFHWLSRIVGQECWCRSSRGVGSASGGV